MQVRFEVFKGMTRSWDRLFREASEFATNIGPDRLISISHSCDHSDGVVTVWYWRESDRNVRRA
jgi:hypothetical protein